MRLRSALLLAVALLASVVAVPAAAVEWVEERAYVPTRHGHLAVELRRPATGRAPVLLTLSPFRYPGPPSATGFETVDRYASRYAAQGYATARADVLGTGDSGGCWTYGGRAEAESAAALVEWLGTRRWSNGRVGVYGWWYDGALALEVATLAPRHLAAVVPVAPVSSWYAYNYDHGVMHNASDDASAAETATQAGSPDGFDLLASVAPPSEPARLPEALDRTPRRAACERAEHGRRGHYLGPAYDAYWRERDWATRAGDVRAAVFFQHGWRDPTTKPDQFTRFWQNLPARVDKRALLGQWGHDDVRLASAPGVVLPVDPWTYLDLFLARHLKGARDRRLDRLPAVLTQGTDRRLRATLPLDVRRTAFRLTDPMSRFGATLRNSGTETSKVYKRDLTSLASEGAVVAYALPFGTDTRLVGAAEVTLRLTCSERRGQLAVTLIDLPPGAVGGDVVALGLLDLRFRNRPDEPQDVPTGPFTATVTVRPQDHVIKRGHRLAVVVAGSEAVWGVPDPVVRQDIEILPGSVARLPLTSAGGVVG